MGDAMATAEKTLSDLVRELPPEAQAEVRDFVEFLLQKQRRQSDTSPATPAGQEWPPRFFEQTAGALADDPTFTRPPQGDYEVRDRLP
jgi:hypothetical protein